MSMGIALYCLVVALLISAVVQISTSMPVTSFKHVWQSVLSALNS